MNNTEIGKCEASEGWQGRVVRKLAAAGAAGGGAGAVIGALKGTPVRRSAVLTAASCSLFAAMFSVVQEGVRFVQCRDNVVNSILGGGTAGYAATRIHGAGRGQANQMALYCSIIAGGAHLVVDQLPPHWFRRLLVRMDLLDDPGLLQRMQDAESPVPGKLSSAADLPPDSLMLPQSERRGWKRWIPLQKMTPEQALERQHHDEKLFRERVELAREGGLPVLVERVRSAGDKTN